MTELCETLRAAREAFDARRYREAATLFESLVGANPDDPEILLLSARAALLDRQFDEALVRSLRATYRIPEQDAGFEMWADAADALGDTEQAMEAWRTLLDARPEHADARRQLDRLQARARIGSAKRD